MAVGEINFVVKLHFGVLKTDCYREVAVVTIYGGAIVALLQNGKPKQKPVPK